MPWLQVLFIGTSELLAAEWTATDYRCALLCMPGGADLPYCRNLNGRGNQIIKGG